LPPDPDEPALLDVELPPQPPSKTSAAARQAPLKSLRDIIPTLTHKLTMSARVAAVGPVLKSSQSHDACNNEEV
jgi:hypothetical protein